MSANFDYHPDGQIASVTYADGRRENYLWDGLALIHRNGTDILNEPAITGGNPVLSGDKVLFNDLLGNTLGVKDQSSYQPIRMTAFGESDNADAFFTGKPLPERFRRNYETLRKFPPVGKKPAAQAKSE